MKPQKRQMFSHNASEGIEPQNNSHRTGSRISFSGNQYQYIQQRREYIGVLGSKSVAGYRIEFNGTWENQSVPSRSSEGVEEMTKEYGRLVVGLTHIRGVNRVMSIASRNKETLEGVSSLMQREKE